MTPKLLERSHFVLRDAFFQTKQCYSPKIKHFATPPIFGLATPLVAWKKILIYMWPSSPRQTWSSNLNHTASQLFQVASPRAYQRRLMWMARKRLGSPSQVGQKSETAAWTPATTLLSNLCIASSQRLVLWYAYFLDKGNEQCHHRKFVSSTRTTSTYMQPMVS